MSVLDVGQGDAILLRDGASAVLVDTGPSGTTMKAAIARTGVRRLDAVVLTHAHDDHTGGLTGLGEVARILSVYRACDPAAQPGRERAPPDVPAIGDVKTCAVAVGDRFSVGRWRLEVLWPEAGRRDPESANDESLVILARYGAFEMLLTGDAESEVLDQIGEQGALRDIDVLKVGHHGSRVSLDPTVLRVLKPEIAVVSVGRGNRFGHPAPATLQLLERSAARIVRTDVNGDVTFRVREGEFTVETDR